MAEICYNAGMNSPFAGMDPYLEHHALWQDVHNSLITAIRDAVAPMVAPDYYVGLESRAYIIKPDGDKFLGRPDLSIISPVGTLPSATVVGSAISDVAVLEVDLPIEEEVNHYYLEVRSVQTHDLITTIELLSPVNKVDARGRAEYQQKRYEALISLTNYVEIDLLRDGEPMPLNQQVQSDYRILVSRGWTRRKAHLYAFNLPTPIPDFPLPLMPDDKEPMVPLNEILHNMYRRARFDLRIDYSQSPVPAFNKTQMAWATQLLST